MANLNELKPVGSLNPFGHFCCTIGHLPTSYMVSLTYEEQLMWLCNYLENTIIPAVNTNAEAVKELQELYVKLKNWIDNYFNNLDVQQEINNKLDEMATDGTLENIINQEIFGDINNTLNSLNDEINKLKNSQNPIDFYKNKNLVVFGDSFTDPVNNNSLNGYWVNRVATTTGMKAFNFAKRGS